MVSLFVRTVKGKIFLFPVNLVPNSSYISSPGAHICSPMGTQVSVVFRSRRIKSNNHPPNPQTQQDGPLHGITCLFREIVRSMRVNQLLYSNLVGLKKWRIFLFFLWVQRGLSECEPCSPLLPGTLVLFGQFCCLQVTPMALFDGFCFSFCCNWYMLLIQNLLVEFRVCSIYVSLKMTALSFFPSPQIPQ